MLGFVKYLSGLAEEGETLLLVRQKPLLKGGDLQRYGDGALKATWVPLLPSSISKVKADWAIYGNTAAFVSDRLKAKLSASNTNCERVLVMVLDDIGTKSKAPPIEPTWKMETSEGSFQWGYVFSEQPPKGVYAAAIRAIAGAGYTDPGAVNAVRNFRLPGSVNLKPGKGGFKSLLVEFQPDREFTLDEITGAMGVTYDKNSTPVVWPINTQDTRGDEVLTWLDKNRLVLSPVNTEGWCSVICPNHEQHSDPADASARYHPGDRAFVCYHGHCADFSSQDFLDWVSDNGGPSCTHGMRAEQIPNSMSLVLDKLPPGSNAQDHAEKVMARIEAKEIGRTTKKDWFTRFAYVQSDDSFFDMETRRETSRGTFNALYRHIGCSSIHSTKGRRIEASVSFDENREACGAKALVGITYAAGEPPVLAVEGELYGNKWKNARPDFELVEGDISPWLSHAERLIPEAKERAHIFDVMAFKLQHPGIKINHAVLHGGLEGSGKDTLWAPFIWAVCGPQLINRGFMDANALHGQWGYHLESEILLLNELKEPNASDRRELANRLKPIISAPPEYIEINRKNMAPYKALNRVFVLAFTNEQIPISLASQDRRWFCVWSAAPRMGATESKKMWDWYKNGGYEAIASWLYARDVTEFNPQAAPFDTEFKINLIEGGRSISEAYLVELITNRSGEFASGVVGSPFVNLCDRLASTAPSGAKVPQAALLHALEEAGWVDMGRIKSKRYDSKKRVFCDPSMRYESRSDLRDLVEEPPPAQAFNLKTQHKHERN